MAKRPGPTLHLKQLHKRSEYLSEMIKNPETRPTSLPYLREEQGSLAWAIDKLAHWAPQGELYLLCFDEPLGDPSRPRMSARHYLGWCNAGGLEERLRMHAAGRGAAITRRASERGIGWIVAWQSTGTRFNERRMKRNGNFARRCARCKEKTK